MSKPTRLLVNGRFITQQRTGVQNFAHQLCRELYAAGIDFELAIPRNADILHPMHEVKTVRYGYLRGHAWEQLELPRLAKRHGALLLNLCNTGPMGWSNQVTVLHDLAFVVNPRWFNPLFSKWYAYMVPRMIKNCRHLVTVSNQVKSEIMDRFQMDGHHISVLGNKVDEELLNSKPQRPTAMSAEDSDFFLMVGSNDPRKNFEPALRKLTEEMGRKVLVIGGDGRAFGKSDLIDNPHVIRVGRVDLSELKWAYMHAKALVSPSLYEGFGLPNLEAMAMGCPLIVSDIPIFREVCGNAAIYFNPIDLLTLTEAVDAIDQGSKPLHQIEAGKTIFTDYQSINRAHIIKKICEIG